MKKASNKDIFQTIKKSRKRFVAIMIITTLGVAMFSGLTASCQDLRKSADLLFDKQNLHDLSIVSTLGLTQEDVDVVLGLDYVDQVDGIYCETLETKIHNKNFSLTIQTISDKIDEPYILEGRLPEKSDEVVVTEKFIEDTQTKLNDSFEMDVDQDSKCKIDSFTIVGVVLDVTSVDNPLSCTSFRSDNIKDNTVFVCKDAFDNDIYTSIICTLKNSNSYFCYGDEYKQYVKESKNDIEKNIKNQREQARYQEVYDDAYNEIHDEEVKVKKELKEALQELEDAQKEISNGFVQIYDAINTLNQNEATAISQFQQAREEIEENRIKINDGLTQVEQGQAQLNEGKAQLENEAGMSCEEIKSSFNTLCDSIETLQNQIQYITDEQQLMEMQIQLEMMNQQKEQFQQAYESVLTIETLQTTLNENREQLNSALQQVNDGEVQLQQQESSVYAQIESGRNEINENYQKLVDGQQELDEGYAEYEEGKEKAEKEFKKAYKKLEDIDVATWYVQDRSSLNGYNNVGSDADSIEAIARVFPLVFLVIAMLISLTTISRMVEEDRGLIGTYKALGFTRKEILKKYFVYSIFACGTGCLMGTFIAFIVLPTVLFMIFRTMYLLPEYYLYFVPLNGVLGPCVFLGSIVLAAYFACFSELRQSPASLMRPKAPKAGSRVLLERIPFIWNRLSFLNKVTIRNLFRYKKRMFMTIFGIAGCMALLLFGLGIKNSVQDLMPRQYEQTFKYDCMVVSSDNKKLLSYVEDDQIESYVNVEISSSTIIRKNEELSITLVVFPDDVDSSQYIQLKDLNKKNIELKNGDIYITQNAANVLGFEEGDTVSLHLLNLEESELEVSGIVKNYLGNYIYMTQSTFETYYKKYEPNSTFLQFNEKCENQKEFCDQLGEKDGIIKCLSTEELEEQFSDAFALINMVVYVIIFMSAALAFVVLFTLATVNISERERELATIKVLGFVNREVHLYVDKETFILTFIGIVIGIPLGRAFVSTLTIILNLPSIYLETSLYTSSYFIAMGLSVVFAIIVSLIMDKSLDEINPVEALKSIE